MAGRGRVWLGLLSGVAACSTAAILVRSASAPPLSVAAWRLALASGPALLFAALRRRQELSALPRRGWLLLGGAGVALALHFATWIASLGMTTVAASVALVSTSPVFVALLSRFALGEPVGRRTALGIGVALVGAALVAAADLSAGRGALSGDALAVAGAAMAALYFAAGRRVRAGLSLGAYVGVVYPVAALALVGLALAFGQPLAGFPGGTWLAFAGLALLPQLLGHSLLNWSLRWLSAPFVAVAILGEPVASTLLALVLLGERPGPLLLAGGLATLCGVGLAATEEARATPAAARAEQAPP